jgi:hypothetical protein
VEQRCGHGNCWWDAHFGGLAELAFVAGGDVGLDVLCKCRPPEAVEDGTEGGVEALVAEVVMCFIDCWALLVREEDKLVSALWVLSPELSIVDGERL